MSKQRLYANKLRQRIRGKENRVIVGDLGATIAVLSAKRRVQLIVRGFMGVAAADSTINLDEAAVDKLILRLMRIRGGKVARRMPVVENAAK
jgi:uncharacterized tellurite resistance protein B-like protein